VKLDVHEHEFKKIREWKYFLEKNRKLVKFYDDHPETEKV
jgi:hypothetical protein